MINQSEIKSNHHTIPNENNIEIINTQLDISWKLLSQHEIEGGEKSTIKMWRKFVSFLLKALLREQYDRN